MKKETLIPIKYNKINLPKVPDVPSVHDTKQFILGNYAQYIPENILNNPAFEEELAYTINALIEYNLKNKNVNNNEINMICDDEEKSITFRNYPKRSPYIDSQKVSNIFFRNIKFTDKCNMVVEKCEGTYYDKDEYEKEKNITSASKCCTILETKYSQKIFNKDGIEISNSKYSDINYTDDEDEITLYANTLSKAYKPVFHYDKLPDRPFNTNNPSMSNNYRYENKLEITYSQTEKNIHKYISSTKRPDKIETNEKSIPVEALINNDLNFEKSIKYEFQKAVEELERLNGSNVYSSILELMSNENKVR